ncbi:MAG: hypothetical protein Q3X95_03880 [Duodenibacillus sp.]|nr:hypothetical protein [Duodenibacillus sp.]
MDVEEGQNPSEVRERPKSGFEALKKGKRAPSIDSETSKTSGSVKRVRLRQSEGAGFLKRTRL